MKNYLSIMLLFTTVLICTACGKSTSEINSLEESLSVVHMTVTIDGTEFTTTKSQVSANPDNTGVFVISGREFTEGDDSSISFYLNSPTSEGTFLAEDNTVTLTYLEGDSMWNADSQYGLGTLTISQNTSNLMEGTFSFTGVNRIEDTTKEFMNGSFKVIKI